MRYRNIYLLLTLFFIVNSTAQAQNSFFKSPERGFTSWKPAVKWENALLTGNGTLGALVMGDPHQETIIVSHGSLFLPIHKSDSLINQGAKLDLMRSLISKGEYQHAADIPAQLRVTNDYVDEREPFLPAFDVKIEQESGNIIRYVRSVDYNTGVASTAWEDNNGQFQRNVFASRADSILVINMQSDHRFDVVVNFQHRPIEWNQWSFINNYINEMSSDTEQGQWLTYRSSFKKRYTGSIQGYEGVGKLIVDGGTTSSKEGKIYVEGAEQVTLLVKLGVNYNYSESLIDTYKKELNTKAESYNQLLERHATIHGSIFSRMKLDLNADPALKQFNSEELILNTDQQGVSAAMIEQVFDAGRYNILSSAGQSPPNLQGVWAGDWMAPWGSGYTHDGNLPSAMAVVMPGNMPELMKGYVQYLEHFTPEFKTNALRLFKARGINLPAHTTTSGWPTDFNKTWCLSLWTGGAGWAADIMYDYYNYTQDLTFLRAHAYPWLKNTALFYEDFLIEGEDGNWIFTPSYSPENNPANSNSQVAVNATMDIMIAKQVLTHAIEAGKLIGEKNRRLKKWQQMIDKMPDYMVNEEGVLKEWAVDSLEENYEHRHVSQLYSLFNGADDDILSDSILFLGAERLIDKKLEFRRKENGGEMAFGLVQLGLSAANMGNGTQAYDAVKWLSSKYWSNSFASYHNVKGLFNMDISGGLPALIIKMIITSDHNTINLLPAIPGEWTNGSLQGGLLCDGLSYDAVEWSEEGVSLSLRSQSNQKVIIKTPYPSEIQTNNLAIRSLNDRTFELKIKSGELVTCNFRYILN